MSAFAAPGPVDTGMGLHEAAMSGGGPGMFMADVSGGPTVMPAGRGNGGRQSVDQEFQQNMEAITPKFDVVEAAAQLFGGDGAGGEMAP